MHLLCNRFQFQFLNGFLSSSRSVERVQRSLSLGLQTILIRGLGTVPGPVVFGFVMDSTCLLWRRRENSNFEADGCEEGGGEGEGGKRAGSCLVYDNAAMSLSVLGILLAWRAAAAVAMGGALYFSKRSTVVEEAEDDEDEDR